MHFSSIVHGLLLATSACLAATADEWKTRSIYFVLTDRFAKTDLSDTTACSNLGDYCGGTWKGMEQKLDYIKTLGFDAIWITPIVENTPGGYHGYWAKNLYNVSSNLGSAADLKSLVDTAHTKGMYIMVDVVANHMGRYGNNPGVDDISTFVPFNNWGYYHNNCVITNYNDQANVEYCRFVDDLPDVKTDDPNVRAIFNDWINNLVRTYAIDGLRVDTVKHVEKPFWPGFTAAGGVFAMGEVYNGDPWYVGDYQHYMSSLVNFPMYYAITDSYGRKASMQNLVDQHNRVSTAFPRPELLGTFLDNHDVQRFLAVNGDWTALKNALAYTLLARGIPILYGGTEQTYRGGNDPANREDLWRSGYATNGDLYTWIQKALAVKRDLGGLGDNDHVHLFVLGNAYAFSRAGGRLIVFTTNGGSGTDGNYCFNAQRGQGVTYRSVLSGATYTSNWKGDLCIQISNGQPEIFVQV